MARMADTLSSMSAFCVPAPARTPSAFTRVRSPSTSAESTPSGCERHRRGRHAAGLDEQQQRPGVTERQSRVERLAQVGVLAPRLRPARAQLGVDEGPGKGDRAAQEPRPDRGRAAPGSRGHHGRVHEDPRADHPAHHDQRDVGQPELAGERRSMGHSLHRAASSGATGERDRASLPVRTPRDWAGDPPFATIPRCASSARPAT